MPSITPQIRAVAVAVGLFLTGLIAWGAPLGVDYLAPPCKDYICDDAGPAVEALAAGDVDLFFAEQPPMGSASIFLRAPFVAATDAAGGGAIHLYRVGAFVCMLALLALALHVGFTMARRGRDWKVAAFVPLGMLAGPVTSAALEFGHPEELMAAALMVAAVIAAGRDRAIAAGLLLGTAVATKQWAAMAALPMLVVLPRRRLWLIGSSAATFALFTVPMMLGNWSRYWESQEALTSKLPFDGTVTASNVWFQFATGSTGATRTPDGVEVLTQYSLDPGIGHLTHPLVALIALVATGAYWLRRRGANPEEVLQLVALIFLVRCMLDPLTYSYHHAPFLVAIVAYEGLRRRVPVMSGIAIAALLVMTHVVAPLENADLINVYYLAWTFPLAAALVLGVFFPARLDAIAARLTPRRVRALSAASQTAPLP